MDGTHTGGAELGSVVERAVGVLLDEWVSVAQAHRVAEVLGGFVRFCETGFRTRHLDEVSPAIAEAFVVAVGPDGCQPSVPLMHLRRSGLRLLYRVARREGSAAGDPTLDLVLPARSPLSARPLTDEEVSLCRSAATWSLVDSRRSAAWALAEATCRTVEAAQIARDDVRLADGRVWIHGGRTTEDRWGVLNEWGVRQLERRLSSLPQTGNPLVVYQGDQGRATGQVSTCIALRDVLVRAGLGSERGVRPGSVAAWAGHRILADTGQIDEVARRLGIRSLDRAARFIGWSWDEDRAD